LDDGMLKRIEQLTGLRHERDDLITAFNFSRPELSPCLGRIADRNDPRYAEALKIIQAGREKLAHDPRPDMAGFRLSDPDEVNRQCKYDALRKAENEARAAILRNEKKRTNTGY